MNLFLKSKLSGLENVLKEHKWQIYLEQVVTFNKGVLLGLSAQPANIQTQSVPQDADNPSSTNQTMQQYVYLPIENLHQFVKRLFGEQAENLFKGQIKPPFFNCLWVIRPLYFG